MDSKLDLYSSSKYEQGDRKSSKPKALIVSTSYWPTAARVAMALANVGYEVACTSPLGSLVRKTAAVSYHFRYRPWTKLYSISRSVKSYEPDLLICADDQAVVDLHRLRRRASKIGGDANVQLAELISTSLGNPAHFAVVRAKSEFVSWAKSAGLRCPQTVVVPAAEMGDGVPEIVTYPALIKADASTGGEGVKLVKNKQEAMAAILELSTSIGWQALVRRMLTPKYYFLLVQSGLLKRKRTVSLQQIINGSPANRAIFCDRGKVLTGVNALVIKSQAEYGSSSVIRIIEHEEMKAASEAVVKRLQLSGLVGFDFILDKKNRAWLIELNPRITSTSHLCMTVAGDLLATTDSRMSLNAPSAEAEHLLGRTIALFPQELVRCRNSEYVRSGEHDVPWQEPELVRECLRLVEGLGLVRRLRRKLQI